MIRNVPNRTNLKPSSQPLSPTPPPQQSKNGESPMWCPLPNKKQPQHSMTRQGSSPPPRGRPPHGNFSHRIPINPSEKEGEVNMLLQQYKSLTINLNKIRGRLYSLGVNPDN